MNNNKNNYKGLYTIFCLYIAQSIPMSFFSTALPVIMRENGFTLTQIGLLQLIKLPWILKIFWAPFVDRTAKNIGGYKRWIFSSEIIYALLILTISFLNLEINFTLTLSLIIASIVASATQDIATDALSIIYFKERERGLANSVQSMGGFFGTIIGVGGLLYLLDQIGWSLLLPFLAIFVVGAVIPLLFLRHNHLETPQGIEHRASISDLVTFFKKDGAKKQLLLLILFNSGLIGTLAMLKPMLVDAEYSVAQIGVIYGVGGSSIAFLTSFLTGFIIKKRGLEGCGKWVAFIIVGVNIILLTHITFLRLEIFALVATALIWAAYGAANVLIYNFSMNFVRGGREGTDFTLQTVVSSFGAMVVAGISGLAADKIGYGGLLSIELVLAIVSSLYFIKYYKCNR